MQTNLSNGLIAISREDLEKIKKSAYDEGFAAAKKESKETVIEETETAEEPKKGKAKEKVGKNELRRNVVEE